MTELPLTRQSLIVQLRAQNRDAWEELLKVYEAAIYRYCLSRGLQEADACDVTQEVFVAVHQRIETWDVDPAKGSFRGWMFRTARNIAADKAAQRAKQALAAGDTEAIARFANLPEIMDQERTAFIQEYRRALFRWAVEEIRPEVSTTSWQAFLLTAVKGRDAASVAEELNISVSNVYTSKCRIVAKIRAKIVELEENDSDEL
jgi:RNA polymerase sigma-70 factor (ECF subfamily)